jgi:hypothetical protein
MDTCEVEQNLGEPGKVIYNPSSQNILPKLATTVNGRDSFGMRIQIARKARRNPSATFFFAPLTEFKELFQIGGKTFLSIYLKISASQSRAFHAT